MKKKEKVRSMLSSIFGKEEKDDNMKKVVHVLKMLNDTGATFYNWNGKLFDNNTIRAAIGTNGLNAGKLSPKHIRNYDGCINVNPNYNLKRILKQPNKYMNMFDFLQKMKNQLDINNNAFAYIDRNKNIPGMNGIRGIYPLNSSSVEVYEDEFENIYLKFRFKNGQYKLASYDDIIHIRKHFNEDDFWGESNKNPLSEDLEVVNSTKQGIKNAIRNTAFIRGILEFKQVLQQTDIDKNVEDFSEAYLNLDKNDKGLAYTDPRYSFREIKNEPYVPNKAQMDYTKQEIYEYFNTNENIIKGKFSDTEWIAYFETAIEPFAIQMSLEFTKKIFSNMEICFGNEIIFEANRLAYASYTTKIQICKDLGHLFTINEQREIWNRGPVPDGDKRIQSLNYVDASKANEYQLGKSDEKNEEGGNEIGG